MRKHNGMRPQDVIVILKIISSSTQKSELDDNNKGNIEILSNKNIAKSLQMSEAEISESLKRSEYATLITDTKTKKINKKAFLEFILHGIKYVFPIHPGALVRGIATAHSASPIKESIVSKELFVWEHIEGNVRGQAIEPLYSTVPKIVEEDPKLYELLALVDCIRTGNARIFSIAAKELENRILNAW